MKIETSVTINGQIVLEVGKISKSIILYELNDEYGSDLFLVDKIGNIIGNIRVIGEDIQDIKIKQVTQ